MDFIHFGRRMEIERLYLEWCKKEGIANKPNSFVVFLMSNGWLNEEKIIEDLKGREVEPQINYKMPYEDCEDCETYLKAQYGDCNKCKWYGDKQVCGRCRSRNLYAPKDKLQTNKDFEDIYTCSFTDCDNFKNPDYIRCIECKRKQSEAKYKNEPQMERRVK